jgi:protein kinase D
METDMCKYIMESSNKWLDENMSKMLIYQVIIALRYLHSNNCGHLDVKCENILISFLKPISPNNNNNNNTKSGQTIKKNDLPLVKLADFGYSRIIGEHSFRKTRVGTVCHFFSLKINSTNFLLESLLCTRNLS